ncbi:(2Fe-2S)-binding protein [Mycoplasmatota bacterium]|nr:(2Fe-2S)-binding protein [Mycoplasmatota bacterium]
MRIEEHPILNFEKERKVIHFTFNNLPVEGYEGDTIASALHALGIKKFSESMNLKRPRGFYCAIGNCSSCNMIVDGVPNVRTCVTLLKEGMDVKVQSNKGELYVK